MQPEKAIGGARVARLHGVQDGLVLSYQLSPPVVERLKPV